MAQVRQADIAIIGGTGNLGLGLAARWARAGKKVAIGSRTKEKAEAAAETLSADYPGSRIWGRINIDAARDADVVVVTVPYAAHRETLESIRDVVQGKTLIDTTVPLVPPKVSKVSLPTEGSAARAAQILLGDKVDLVAAYHNVAASHIRAVDRKIDCEVLVFGDSADARQQVIDLSRSIGMRGWHAGPLANAVVAESLTSTLIFINRHHKIDGAGIQITGHAHE